MNVLKGANANVDDDNDDDDEKHFVLEFVKMLNIHHIILFEIYLTK